MTANPRLAPPALTASLLALLTACGGSSGGAVAPAAATASPQPSTVVNTGFPGASGLLAALDGRTLQVQSQQTGQVAVTYTDSTTFAKTVGVARSAVTVGSCVIVRSTSGTATAGAVTAAVVSVSKPVKGSCNGRGAGFGGGPGGGVGGGPGGARPSGAPTRLPSGAPSGLPSGAARPGAVGGRPTVGKVTAVSGSSFTVAAVEIRPPGIVASGMPSTSATPSTSPVRVTTAPATTYTSTVAATARDLEVGQCVQAVGTTDDTGSVTATRISTEPAVDGECGGGFGGGFGRATSTGAR
ncbi:MAG: DUF5666 domain-containing protein [Actinomycetes bacterium]